MTIGELIVELVFKSDNKTLQDFIHDLGELNVKSIFAGAALGGLYEGLKKIMEGADHAATALNNMMGITGVSAREFERWDNAAQQFGVSAGATSSAIGNIQSQIFELIKTGSGPGQMIGQLLGIDPRGFASHPEELLRKELEYLKQFDPATRRFYAQILGINDEMLLLVDHTDELDRTLINQADELQTIAEWHQIVNKLAGDFRVLLISIGAIVGPLLEPIVFVFTKIVEAIEFIAQKLPGVIQGFIVLATVIAAIAGIINPIYGALAALAGVGAIAHASNQVSKNLSMSNTYNINGGNPQDVRRAIEDHWQRTTHESDLMGPQTNY